MTSFGRGPRLIALILLPGLLANQTWRSRPCGSPVRPWPSPVFAEQAIPPARAAYTHPDYSKVVTSNVFSKASRPASRTPIQRLEEDFQIFTTPGSKGPKVRSEDIPDVEWAMSGLRPAQEKPIFTLGDLPTLTCEGSLDMFPRLSGDVGGYHASKVVLGFVQGISHPVAIKVLNPYLSIAERRDMAEVAQVSAHLGFHPEIFGVLRNAKGVPTALVMQPARIDETEIVNQSLRPDHPFETALNVIATRARDAGLDPRRFGSDIVCTPHHELMAIDASANWIEDPSLFQRYVNARRKGPSHMDPALWAELEAPHREFLNRHFQGEEAQALSLMTWNVLSSQRWPFITQARAAGLALEVVADLVHYRERMDSRLVELEKAFPEALVALILRHASGYQGVHRGILSFLNYRFMEQGHVPEERLIRSAQADYESATDRANAVRFFEPWALTYMIKLDQRDVAIADFPVHGSPIQSHDLSYSLSTDKTYIGHTPTSATLNVWIHQPHLLEELQRMATMERQERMKEVMWTEREEEMYQGLRTMIQNKRVLLGSVTFDTRKGGDLAHIQLIQRWLKVGSFSAARRAMSPQEWKTFEGHFQSLDKLLEQVFRLGYAPQHGVKTITAAVGASFFYPRATAYLMHRDTIRRINQLFPDAGYQLIRTVAREFLWTIDLPPNDAPAPTTPAQQRLSSAA